MKNSLLTALTISSIALISSTPALAHDCTPEKDQISLHFKSFSLLRTAHIISNYSDRYLVVKTQKDIEIPLHYNCVRWQEVMADLSSKHGFKYSINEDAIILSD